MLLNHLRIAIRNLRRAPSYAAINIAGLGLGFAACLLILHYVQDERAFDRFHEKGDRMYRVVTDGEFPAVGWPVGRILVDEYPEVEQVTYIRTWPTFPLVQEGDRYYEQFFYADEHFLDLFDFPLVDGDPDATLTDPYSIVLSETLSKKLFGDESPIGRTLGYGDRFEVTVAAVARVPAHSHIQFDGLLSMATLRDLMGPANFDQQLESGWHNVNMITYVLLREGVAAESFAETIRDLPEERIGETLSAMGSTMHLILEPLHSIYLQSPRGSAIGPTGDSSRVYLLMAVGLLILLLAAVNFVNLATARSMERAREVGVRKSVGAGRSSLIARFLAESTITAFAAVVVGSVVAIAALPFFSDLFGRSYSHADVFTPSFFAGALSLVAVVGILAGLHPALVLSRFLPAETLRGRYATSARGVRVRQALVVLQFSIASVLLIGTLVVLQQLRYMQTQDPGFDSEQVIIVDAQQAPSASRAVLKEMLEAHAAVRQATSAFALPGQPGWRGQISYPESLSDGQSIALEYLPIDHDYVGTLGIEIVAGRNLNPNIASDAERAVLINEAAVRAAGWASADEAVGQRFTSPGSGKPESMVVGVVRDHHHHGLRERIEPIMYGINTSALGFIALRVEAGQIAPVLSYLEETWHSLLAGYPYTHTFLDEAFGQLYDAERRLARIFATFTFLAILIGCLGLFGLAAFITRQRTREIGVRRVLGATTAQLVARFSRDFLVLVAVAFLVGAPVAYWLMNRWLDDFANRISIGAEVVVVAGAMALIMATVAVAGQALRAALEDPARSLRTEL
jgi:putative ABC transport system permease protein